ncbi:hypothetical protein ANN_00186 [Periplaneta americana]|uniref:Uncharacterized protein n=1 Tax=Periplaneta americana TaxID=6978 RepID=A0ABQ8TQ54_PERAM|nr:hypothetical protein ANN_00186 [Periplaneta americana]
MISRPINDDSTHNLITGTGHGIGKELAHQYAQLGAILVCWDINETENEKTVQELRKMGAKAYGYKCDVSDREAVLELAKKVKQEVGDVTVVVNNAGIMPCHPLLHHNHQEIRKIFDINVFAHFWNNHGHIVALSSMAGVMGIPNLVPYCGSKFAVRGLMEALAEELREDARHIQVKFTSIMPFIVSTGLCKKPRTRFPFLLNFVTPKAAASAIIRAQRRNYAEASIPGGLLYLNNVLRNPPSPLGRSEKETSRKVGRKNWFLMHDNAPAHRAIIVKNFLARHNITALDHPPYSPDLSPPDYFLFPRLKSHLKGRRFNAEEVIANATRALRRVSQNGFQACFQELYTRWQKCVVAEGNYFEGNAVE